MPELRNVKLTEGIITYHPGKYRARLHYSLGKNQAIAEVEARANPNMTCSFLFEIFPHRCTGTRFREFHDAVTNLLTDETFNYENVFENGHVQKVEYAVDFLSVPVDSFLAWTPRSRYSYNHPLNLSHTEHGTRYIGSRRSPLLFKTYDKAKELAEYGLYNPHAIRTRLEAILFEPKVPGSLVQRLRPSQLDQQLNPFRHLQVADLYKVVELPLNEDWKWFLGLSLDSGAAGAIQATFGTRKERLEVRQMLRQCAADWWNPASVWEGHEQANSMISPKHLLLANDTFSTSTEVKICS